MEWWGENLTDGVKRRGNGVSKNIQLDREGCERKQGPEKFLLFVSLFFSLFFKAIKTMVCLTLIVINLVKNKKLTVVGKRELQEQYPWKQARVLYPVPKLRD